jgi:hypothetical protein
MQNNAEEDGFQQLVVEHILQDLARHHDAHRRTNRVGVTALSLSGEGAGRVAVGPMVADDMGTEAHADGQAACTRERHQLPLVGVVAPSPTGLRATLHSHAPVGAC